VALRLAELRLQAFLFQTIQSVINTRISTNETIATMAQAGKVNGATSFSGHEGDSSVAGERPSVTKGTEKHDA